MLLATGKIPFRVNKSACFLKIQTPDIFIQKTAPTSQQTYFPLNNSECFYSIYSFRVWKENPWLASLLYSPQYSNKHYTHAVQTLDIICIGNNASPAVGTTKIVSSSFTLVRKIRGLQKIRRVKEHWRWYHKMNKSLFKKKQTQTGNPNLNLHYCNLFLLF